MITEKQLPFSKEGLQCVRAESLQPGMVVIEWDMEGRRLPRTITAIEVDRFAEITFDDGRTVTWARYVDVHVKPIAMQTKTLVAVEDLKPGMVILPPAREISLWMRKLLQEKAWPESAMYLTITAVEEGRCDTRGRWILVKADHTEQWNDRLTSTYPFTFKARPDTLWPVIGGDQS